jgi:hypothetical protein
MFLNVLVSYNLLFIDVNALIIMLYCFIIKIRYMCTIYVYLYTAGV